MAIDPDLMNAIREVLAAELDARGLKRLPSDSTVAERMRRYRARKAERAAKAPAGKRAKRNANRNAERNENRNATEGEGVTLTVTQGRNGHHHPATEVWESYAAAYERRYSVPPVRNARTNGIVAKFVNRVPTAEAPAIAQWFVASNRGLYVSARHDVTLLLRDAEGLRTEWATQRTVTESEARQMDATAGRGNVWGRLIAEIDERAKGRQQGDFNEP